MWPSLIETAKKGGIDVIETYVFWNGHEPSPGNVGFVWLNLHISCALNSVSTGVIVLIVGFTGNAVLFWWEVRPSQVLEAHPSCRTVLYSSNRAIRCRRMEFWVCYFLCFFISWIPFLPIGNASEREGMERIFAAQPQCAIINYSSFLKNWCI